MIRYPLAAAILLTLVPVIGLAQTQKRASSKTAPSRTRAAKTPATGDILPFPATEKTLPNGLKVIVVPTGFPNIVSLQIPVQTGSRNEVEAGKSGSPISSST